MQDRKNACARSCYPSFSFLANQRSLCTPGCHLAQTRPHCRGQIKKLSHCGNIKDFKSFGVFPHVFLQKRQVDYLTSRRYPFVHPSAGPSSHMPLHICIQSSREEASFHFLNQRLDDPAQSSEPKQSKPWGEVHSAFRSVTILGPGGCKQSGPFDTGS